MNLKDNIVENTQKFKQKLFDSIKLKSNYYTICRSFNKFFIENKMKVISNTILDKNCERKFIFFTVIKQYSLATHKILLNYKSILQNDFISLIEFLLEEEDYYGIAIVLDFYIRVLDKKYLFCFLKKIKFNYLLLTLTIMEIQKVITPKVEEIIEIVTNLKFSNLFLIGQILGIE